MSTRIIRSEQPRKNFATVSSMRQNVYQVAVGCICNVSGAVKVNITEVDRTGFTTRAAIVDREGNELAFYTDVTHLPANEQCPPGFMDCRA